MSSLMLQCKKCDSLFPSGIGIGGNSAVTITNCKSRCPYCGSMEQIPDGTFKSTLDGIVHVLGKSSNPLQTVKDVLHELEKAKRQNNTTSLKQSNSAAEFKKWLPNSPEKIAAYIAIFYTLYLLLSKQPAQTIEYNQTFINNYNQVIIEQPKINHQSNPATLNAPKRKIGRNEPCYCGSGIKYKKCCLNRI